MASNDLRLNLRADLDTNLLNLEKAPSLCGLTGVAIVITLLSFSSCNKFDDDVKHLTGV